MQIKQLDKEVSRIFFASRAEFCENLSRKRLGIHQPLSFKKEKGETYVYNHELEILALRSVVSRETKIEYYSKAVWLHRCIRYIRDQEYISNLIVENDMDSALAGIQFLQFSGQQTYDFLYYRYNFFFNFCNEEINMKQIFESKINIPYMFFDLFIYVTQVWATLEDYCNFNNFTAFIGEELSNVLRFLTTEREEFIEEYKEYTSNEKSTIIFDFNLLISKPFIIFEGIVYCMYAPYIPYACTKSLMFEVTKGDDTLRSFIGKNVIEEYVYDLVTNSKVTNKFNCIKEFEYKNGRENERSPDIIIYSTKEILFLEVKFFNQGLNLRSLDNIAINTAKQRIGKSITQLYKSIYKFEKGLMSCALPNTEYKKIYGMIILYDEFYFSRLDSYELAQKEMISFGIQAEFQEIVNKIRIMPLSFFESVLYHSSDDIFEYCELLFDPIKMNFNDRYYTFFNETKGNMPVIDKFLDNRFNQYKSLYEEKLKWLKKENESKMI